MSGTSINIYQKNPKKPQKTDFRHGQNQSSNGMDIAIN